MLLDIKSTIIMKNLLLLICFISFGIANAQTDSVTMQSLKSAIEARNEEINQLQSANNRLGKNILDLKKSDQSLASKIDSLSDLLSQNKQAISQLNALIDSQKAELTGQIKETKQSASERIASLDESLSKNTLYWIIAVLAVGLITLALFLILRKRVVENQSSIVENLSATRKQLEQEGIRLDEKLIGVMETQLKVIQEEKTSTGNNSEPDHSLALKVADEIVRIEKNISQMDEGTKGLKQLSKAVERIRDNFAANGYEMVEMLGKPYDDGMKVTANFRPDENLTEGERVISRIIKPQVNFKGVMIQSAQIEVSQGE